MGIREECIGILGVIGIPYFRWLAAYWSSEVRDHPSGCFTAAQAIAHIAFGDANAFEQPQHGTISIDEGVEGYSSNAWAHPRRVPPLKHLRWVWARVKWRLTRSRRSGQWRQCPLPSLPAKQRSKLRCLLHTDTRTTPELLEQMNIDIRTARALNAAAAVSYAEHIEQASRALCNAAADGHFRVFGRRGIARDETFFNSQHEQVPPEYFLHLDRVIETDGAGWAILGTTAPIEELVMSTTVDSSEWGDLRFPIAPFLAQFPTASPGQTEQGTKPNLDPGRPSKTEQIKLEHARRLKSGEAFTSLAREAEYLLTWFTEAYPRNKAPVLSTIENSVRRAHRYRPQQSHVNK